VPKIVSIVGHHNAGKTTLIEALIPRLQAMGLRVGYLKHDPKGHGITDKEGSDTHRIFRLTEKVGLLSPEKLTLWEKVYDNPLEVVEKYFSDFDLVILEGWKGLEGIKRVVLGGLELEGFRVMGLENLQKVIDYILEE
jgi:molybdopterin-guanine dinucleotide biosynthesis protein B